RCELSPLSLHDALPILTVASRLCQSATTYRGASSASQITIVMSSCRIAAPHGTRYRGAHAIRTWVAPGTAPVAVIVTVARPGGIGHGRPVDQSIASVRSSPLGPITAIGSAVIVIVSPAPSGDGGVTVYCRCHSSWSIAAISCVTGP